MERAATTGCIRAQKISWAFQNPKLSWEKPGKKLVTLEKNIINFWNEGLPSLAEFGHKKSVGSLGTQSHV